MTFKLLNPNLLAIGMVAVKGITSFLLYKIRTNASAVSRPAVYGEDRYITVKDYRIHYVEAGEGEPLFLIPGSFSTYRTWNRIFPLLSDHFRLIALDYVGAGSSDKPRSDFHYTIDEQADLIALMIEQLGYKQVNLAGVSYGGTIVLNLAARYPNLVSRVISIEGGIVKPAKLPAHPLEKLLRYPVLGDLVIYTTKTGIFNTAVLKMVLGDWYAQLTAAERQEQLDLIRHNAGSAHRIAWYWISISHRTGTDFSSQAKTITAPILYLYGKQSDFREMVQDNLVFFDRCLPHAQTLGFEDGIHDLENQKPLETALLIQQFCTERLHNIES